MRGSRFALLLLLVVCNPWSLSGTTYIVSGFGNQNADGSGSSNPSPVLKYVQQAYVSFSTCQAAAAGVTLPPAALCAGPIAGQTGTDSCQGDVSVVCFARLSVCSHVVSVGRAAGGAGERLVSLGGRGVDRHFDGRRAGEEEAVLCGVGI